MIKSYPRLFGIIIAVICFVLDYASKQLIITDIMNPPEIIQITSFFNIVLAWNTGVSFSLFDSYGVTGTNILIAVSSSITLVFLIWLYKTKSPWMTSALGMVIGGALGNLYDRIAYGAVIDFLDFHLNGLSWPAFNFADTFIAIGVIYILIDSFFDHKGDQNA